MRWGRAFIAAVCACALVAGGAAPAYGAGGRATKRVGPGGAVPARWNLPKPAVVPHDDVAPPGAGGILGDGQNTIAFTSFDTGDMIVVLGTTFGHAGCWSDTLYSASRGLYSYCIWSANTTPVNGVQLEQPVKYRAYDRAYGLWVPKKAGCGSAVVSYCALQMGEPYNIVSSKTDYGRWYCSKLPWVGWKLKAGVDLDADGGSWVWPVDLVTDSDTAVFASAS